MSTKNNSKWKFWQTIYIVFGAYFLSILTSVIASTLMSDSSYGEVEKNFTIYAVNAATILLVASVFLKKKNIKKERMKKIKKEKENKTKKAGKGRKRNPLGLLVYKPYF